MSTTEKEIEEMAAEYATCRPVNGSHITAYDIISSRENGYVAGFRAGQANLLEKAAEGFEKWNKDNSHPNQDTIISIGKIGREKIWQASRLSSEKERQSTELFWKLKLQELQDKHEMESKRLIQDLSTTAENELVLNRKIIRLREALENWIAWEDAQIEKEGPYAGPAITDLINQGRKVLREAEK